MTAGFIKKMRALSMGVKLSGTLVLMVLITASVVSYLEDRFVLNYMENHARVMLSRSLGSAADMLDYALYDGVSPEQALNRATGSQREGAFKNETLFLIKPPGRLILPERYKNRPMFGTLALQNMLRRKRGLESLKVDGRVVWAAYQPLGEGPDLLGLMAEREAVLGGELQKLHALVLATTLALSLVVGLGAILLARWVLIKPLRGLTKEAGRVADGDLTPPQPLKGRYDELGRLSHSLHRMAKASQVMVESARSSQARFQQLFTENRDAIIIIGEDGRVKDVNPAAVRIFGYPDRERMVAMEFTDPLFVNAQERAYYLEVLDEQGFVKDFPAAMKRRDGSRFEALITATRRGLRGRFALVRDVTQMRSAQRALMRSEERYRRLIENAPGVFYRWRTEAERFDYFSPAMKELSGYEAAEVMGNRDVLKRLIHPDSQREVFENWRTMRSDGGPDVMEQEYRILHRAGGARWVRERNLAVRDSRGRVEVIEGFISDITGPKKLELELVKGQQMVEVTLRGMPIPAMVIDREHRVVHWNQALERLTGVAAAEMVGSSRQWRAFYPRPRPLLADLMIDMDWDGIKRLYGDKGIRGSHLIGGGLECDMLFNNLGGKQRFIYFLAAPILDEDCRVARVVVTMVDFSEKHKLEQELRRLSVTDDLTGLFNQRSFYAALAREEEETRRYGDPLSLLLMDLDHFKDYNDSFGHLEGDKVLAACAQALKDQVRSTDLTCRYGGEEFVALLPHTSLSEALVVAERVRAAVEGLEFRPVLPDGRVEKAGVSVCVGAAAYNREMGAHGLVRRADQAMYLAKSRGRNRVAAYRGEGRIEVLEPADPIG